MPLSNMFDVSPVVWPCVSQISISQCSLIILWSSFIQTDTATWRSIKPPWIRDEDNWLLVVFDSDASSLVFDLWKVILHFCGLTLKRCLSKEISEKKWNALGICYHFLPPWTLCMLIELSFFSFGALASVLCLFVWGGLLKCLQASHEWRHWEWAFSSWTVLKGQNKLYSTVWVS